MGTYFKAFQYRLKPTEEQLQLLLQQGGNTRFLYNKFVELNEAKYQAEKKFSFARDLINLITELKSENECCY